MPGHQLCCQSHLWACSHRLWFVHISDSSEHIAFWVLLYCLSGSQLLGHICNVCPQLQTPLALSWAWVAAGYTQQQAIVICIPSLSRAGETGWRALWLQAAFVGVREGYRMVLLGLLPPMQSLEVAGSAWESSGFLRWILPIFAHFVELRGTRRLPVPGRSEVNKFKSWLTTS